MSAAVPGLAASEPKSAKASHALTGTRRAMLAAAKSWAYQLRIRDLSPLVASDADVLVIDHGYAARHNGKIAFDAQDIAPLKIKPDGHRRPVLAYLSIGEAEQYRFYWQGAWCQRASAPKWMGAVNPNWPGNYPVRFWDPDWQRIILDPAGGYLARIQAQGFDGIYLDRTDVYSEWTKERPAAERDMIVFLGRIAEAARARDPRFLIVMQNAEELLVHGSVRRLIDGVAKEDLLHGVSFTEAPNDAETVSAAVGYLKRAKADRIPVFAVEYLTDAAKIEAARQQLQRYGFVATIAPRLLDGAPSGQKAAASPGSAASTREPLPQPLVQAATPQAPPASWGEGGPTCLMD